MNHDEVAFLLAVGYSLAEIMRIAADRAQGAAEGTQGAQGAAEGTQGAQGAAEGTQGAQGAAEGAEGAQGAAEGTQGAQGAAEGAEDAEGAAEGAESADNLKRENEQLRRQIQELNRKNAVFEQAKEKTLDEILFHIMEEYK